MQRWCLGDWEVLAERAGEAGAVRLDVEGGDDAVLYDHGVTLGADAAERGQVCSQVQGLGEGSLWISQHPHLQKTFIVFNSCWAD